ncbi:MAG: hypothetical protein O2971_05920 [Proteobacteria bacterium]|nr:hypothetical protein [Pseudomonadota bacterium]
MQHLRKTLGILTLMLLALGSISVQAQQPRFLSLIPPEGLPIIPIMEGWIVNPNGSRSFSYGYLNRNQDAVDIPLGEANFMDPTEFSGMQPTHFIPGRHTGVFAVTVPQDQADIDVWWNLKTGDQEVLKVPGRAGRAAYELDFILPRPQGSLQPIAGFGESNGISAGLFASVRDYPVSVKAGSEVLLTVQVEDPSVRDSDDPRFTEVVPIGVTFNKYQGAGAITFTSHPDHASTVEVEEQPKEPSVLCQGCTLVANQSGPNVVSVPGGEGLARVYASFIEPGDYIIHAKVDNFGAPDSSNTNQCCWTNVYQRITVTP